MAKLKSMTRRRYPRRWPMIVLTDLIARFMPTAIRRSDALILRLFGIGDALIFRMVLDKYAEALNLPISQVTVLGSEAWEAAARLFFHDVEVLVIDERRCSKEFMYRLKVMRRLRRRGFHIAISGMRFRHPHVVESLMLASGAKHRIVVKARPNEKLDAMFDYYSKRMSTVVDLPEPDRPRSADGKPLPLTHEIDNQLQFLGRVCNQPLKLDALPKLPFRRGSPPLVSAGERYAVLNLGASHEPRRWPLKNFFSIALRLLQAGYSVVFLGGPAETDLRRQIDAHLPAERKMTYPRIYVAVNCLDFPSAANLLAHAGLVISNDSGMGHLALMLDRPSVLLVGGGHFGSFMPYPPHLTPARTRFVHFPMECFHCNWNCTKMPAGGKTFPCVANISVEQTWAAVKEIGA